MSSVVINNPTPELGTLEAASFYADQSEHEQAQAAAEWVQSQSFLVKFAVVADAFFKKFVDVFFSRSVPAARF